MEYSGIGNLSLLCLANVAPRSVGTLRALLGAEGDSRARWHGAVIVAEDADLDFAASRCVRGGVVYSGQYCIGVRRILVHRSVEARFTELLVFKVGACR